MTAILDGVFHRVGEVSVRQELENECLTQIPEGLFCRDTAWSVCHGCSLKYSTGMLFRVFDRDGGLGV